MLRNPGTWRCDQSGLAPIDAFPGGFTVLSHWKEVCCYRAELRGIYIRELKAKGSVMGAQSNNMAKVDFLELVENLSVSAPQTE